jgi:hypothetical protein
MAGTGDFDLLTTNFLAYPSSSSPAPITCRHRCAQVSGFAAAMWETGCSTGLILDFDRTFATIDIHG